ncbi:Uncharacterized alpha/beta hydrolase domain [Sulfitobacter delicatus]|uniref:Uncharacterized alpha/beta hydrolase domain n=2 Tax=Sulfitobacter delicatus TaxID=218672 RepID=A0A1G7NK62_9RHOB|nr:Uncharacterized alpha/beta hydrolase domain [Sulfitobacter delicatus]
MTQSQRSESLFRRMFGRLWRRPPTDFGPRRGAVTHVIILDGTMSSLAPGEETNAGLAYGLCREMGSALSIYYEPGLQWRDWRSARDVIMGRGINRQIRRAYGYLASRYRPGDRIFLMGYSRGAYAVRSLAGVIDRVGLLRAEAATERNIRDVYRHYEAQTLSDAGRAFAAANCHAEVEIEAIGAWDTVKSLGINAPLLWRLSHPRHAFHNHDLSMIVKNGFQALALNENRVAYGPVMWTTPEGYEGRLEQVWFTGTHGDIGGQLSGHDAARPLSNIPFVWLMSRMQESGLPLPLGWAHRFPQDPTAPSIGQWRGHGRILMSRRRRVVGADPSERVHESVATRAAEAARPGLLARVQGAISSS